MQGTLTPELIIMEPYLADKIWYVLQPLQHRAERQAKRVCFWRRWISMLAETYLATRAIAPRHLTISPSRKCLPKRQLKALQIIWLTEAPRHLLIRVISTTVPLGRSLSLLQALFLSLIMARYAVILYCFSSDIERLTIDAIYVTST